MGPAPCSCKVDGARIPCKAATSTKTNLRQVPKRTMAATRSGPWLRIVLTIPATRPIRLADSSADHQAGSALPLASE